MRKWKLYVPIFLCFACLLGALLWGVMRFGMQEITPADLRFRDERNNVTLVPYYDDKEDAYYLFLPACTSPSDLTATNPITRKPVSFSLIDIYKGTDSSVPSAAKSHMELTLSRKPYSISIWQCDNLPTVFLEGKPDMLEKVHEDKKTKVSSYVTILDETGEAMLQELGTLSGRGNGSWSGFSGTGAPKRPYNLGFSNPITVGPFEDVTTLCLLAEYSDESKLRNSLVYYAGQELGLSYASAYTYVNLFVNGEYLGLYGVVTKQEYTKHIQEDQIVDVFECTNYFGTHDFYSRILWQPMKLFYGTAEHGEDVATNLEEALTQRDWARCEQLMDMDSFARMYALEEFFCNSDLTFSSQYFYTDYDDVIHTMLPWDFDHTLGSAITHFNPNQDRLLMVYRSETNYSWYLILQEWEAFHLRVADIIETDYTDAFFQKLSDHLLQDMEAIENSRACENRRWESVTADSMQPAASGMETLGEFYAFYTGFFPKRRDFMLEYFRSAEDYCRVSLYSQPESWCSNVMIPKGSRPADYIDEAEFLRRIYPEAAASMALFTESGVPLSEVGPIYDTLLLTASAR